MTIDIPSTGIPISQARQLDFEQHKVSPGDNPAFDAVLAKIKSPTFARSPDDMVRQLAKQQNDHAHTVIRRGGDVVAVLSQNGGVTYPSNSAPDLLGGVMEEAERQGLQGRQLHDFISQRMIERANVFYNGGVQVDVYGAGQGPTMGQINAEMFGADTQRPSALWSEGFDAQTLAYMDRLYRQLT